MKAIILAAGRGTRFKELTKELPKSLLKVKEKTILERQIDLLKKQNIEDIIVVKGFAQDKINFPGLTYCLDEENCYDKIYSLMKAKEFLNGDVLIIYGDILYDERVLIPVINSKNSINVGLDTGWKDYFIQRYGNALEDTVSVAVTDSKITSIGKNNPAQSFEEIYGQFIGFLKLDEVGCKTFIETYEEAKNIFWDQEWVHGRIFQKVRTTDFLQAIIDKGHEVNSVDLKNGWLEFDDINDLNLVNNMEKDKLDKLCRLY